MDAERDNICAQQSNADAPVLLFYMRFASRCYALEMSVIRPETGVRSQSWSGLSGTAASGQGKGMKCFLAAAGGHQRAKKQATSFSLPSPTTLNFSNLSHRIGFFPPATNRPTLYFHHLTHIQNCFLVGAAPETRSKPLIQLQNAD